MSLYMVSNADGSMFICTPSGTDEPDTWDPVAPVNPANLRAHAQANDRAAFKLEADEIRGRGRPADRDAREDAAFLHFQDPPQ